jgi:hypothetical protein
MEETSSAPVVKLPTIDAEAFDAARTVADQLAIINAVSFLNDGEAAIIYRYADEAASRCYPNSLPIIEVGSRFGCSTMTFALAVAHSQLSMVIGIDPHQWQPQPLMGADSLKNLQANLIATGLIQYVVPVLGLSQNLLPLIPDAALIFIDGCHEHDAVLADLESIPQRVWESAAIICGHDYSAIEDVGMAVDEFAAQRGYLVFVKKTIWRMER